MKITLDTINRFEAVTGMNLSFAEETYTFFHDYEDFKHIHGTLDKANYVMISGWDKEGYGCFKTHKAPKVKEVTFDWLMNKYSMNTESNYQSLIKSFKALLPKNQSRYYVASYGIGFDTFCMNKEQIEECTREMKMYLNEYGIEFRNEYSDASWVYRFVISKSKSNLEIINSL